MSEESVVSSRLRDLTESTEPEGRDNTHHSYIELFTVSQAAWSTGSCLDSRDFVFVCRQLTCH